MNRRFDYSDVIAVLACIAIAVMSIISYLYTSRFGYEVCTGVFCAVVNCPLASILLSVELFGSEYLPFFAITAVVSYMLSGYYGLYSSQKIIYSKTRTEYIDAHTH